MRVFSVILLVTLSGLQGITGDFMIGKTPPAEFDILELNGHHLPGDAAKICDAHPICAGFTYRGLLDNAKFPDKTYETYFFRFIHFVDGDRDYANWVTYRTKKPYGERTSVNFGNYRKVLVSSFVFLLMNLLVVIVKYLSTIGNGSLKIDLF